jgi:microcystin-dependent protein
MTNTSLSGGTLRNFVVNDSFINNFSLSGGTILATNIGCNDAGIPNIPKRGVFTNINIFNNNNNNLSINSNGNIDTSGNISGVNITSSGTLSAGNITSIGAISSGNITSNGTINGANITTPGTLNATTIIAGTIGSGNITSTGTISSVNNNVSNKIITNSLDIRSGGILDVSQGTIISNTITGTAITIRSNTSVNTCVMNVTTGNQSSTNANGDGVPKNGIAINNRNVATTQHIKNAIPPGIILAYYSSTNPATPPDGWLICDGQNSTPDLRGRFILGADPRRPTNRAPNLFGGEEDVTLQLHQIPPHTHRDKYTQVGYTGINSGNGNRSVANSHGYFFDETGSAGLGQSHNNMPPYWILIYIMKTSTYNFDYD